MYPKRILQVLTVMTPGGAETTIMNYYRAMDRTKVQFDFLLHRDVKTAYTDEIVALGGRIFIVPPISIKNYLSYLKALNTFFDEHPEYQIIHSHQNALGLWVLKIAKKKGIAVRIAHSHTSVEPFYKKIFLMNTDIPTTIKDAIQSILRYKITKYATHYFSCGEKAGKWLFGSKNDKAVIINNAINASLFAYNPKISLQYKEELKATGKKIIGHVGNFSEAKNMSFLIKIFNELLTVRKDLMLVLVGDSSSNSKIEKDVKKLNIGKNVIFLGVRNDIPSLLQAFDLFLFPSLYEGLPVTLIEAQAAGLKVVASDSITKEVAISKLITFCSLQKSEKEWAQTVLNNLQYDRENTFQQIVDGNYDISQNAKQLQKFYLNNSI